MTISGHHDDESGGTSAYVHDSKNLRNTHIINKSYIQHRTSYIGKRIENAVALAELACERRECVVCFPHAFRSLS